MKAYANELKIGQKGVLTVKPEKREKLYPFWGKPITFLNPTEPVANEDWEILK